MTTVLTEDIQNGGNAKMELRDGESIRYAFLLGSALRNQDSDRFLEVYDTIKPGSLSFSQVNYFHLV